MDELIGLASVKRAMREFYATVDSWTMQCIVSQFVFFFICRVSLDSQIHCLHLQTFAHVFSVFSTLRNLQIWETWQQSLSSLTFGLSKPDLGPDMKPVAAELRKIWVKLVHVTSVVCAVDLPKAQGKKPGWSHWRARVSTCVSLGIQGLAKQWWPGSLETGYNLILFDGLFSSET